ncbi:hypothetical protein ABPG72_014234 [Tetrahymena utriculariae]
MLLFLIIFSFFIFQQVNGQSCANSYIDFEGNCIQQCTTLSGAVNPSAFNQYCICPLNAPYINPQQNGCIQNCSIANSYSNPNPLNFQCILNCPSTIAGSTNPSSFGLACVCSQYVSFDGTQCLTICPNYLSFSKKVCIDDCTTISGSQNPPIKGLTCMCSNPNYFIGPDGMSCVASCSSSYKHIDSYNQQCISNCPQIITNSKNPTGYGQKCICNGAYPYLSLDRTQCIASCPSQSAPNSYGICVCSTNPYIYIDITGNSCIASSTNAYINLDPNYPRFISNCNQNFNVQNPASYNIQCVCSSTTQFLNLDQFNNYFCYSSCVYYQQADPTNFSCTKDCTSFTNMVNPSQFGQKCQCSSSYPFLLPSKQQCSSSCGSNYLGLNPNDKTCYSNCPSSFSNTINSIANNPCKCDIGFPYILNDYSSCTSSCQCFNTNPYSNICITTCSSIINAINPQSKLDQGRCNCRNTAFPYLSVDGSSCVQNCNSQYISIIDDMCDNNCSSYFPSNMPNFNGLRCFCNSSYKYLSEDGKSCTNQCSKYLHPNPNKLVCISDCTKYGMTNPAQLGQACTCSGSTPYLSIKRDMCLSSCPTYGAQNGIYCSCGTNYLKSDNSACSAICSDYYHVDSLLLQCVQNCPVTILGSSNPSSTGQSCQCPSNRPYIRIDMQGGYYCDSSCPNYFIGNFCVDDCSLQSGMSNPLNLNLECQCTNPKQYLHRNTRLCVNSCPLYAHVAKRVCVDSCAIIQGAQNPPSGNTCVCSASNPIYDYSSDSCTNTCNYYLHPNPQIEICFNDCPLQLLNSVNPTDGSNYCQCSTPTFPYYGEQSTSGPLQCVTQCSNYQFFNLCLSDCSQITNAQNPANLSSGNQCICQASAQYRNPNNYSCITQCPQYISLSPNSYDCVSGCSQYLNAMVPNATGNRCLCSNPLYPYVSIDGQSCVSQCNGYISFNQNTCVSDCPSSFQGSINPILYGYQCQCGPSTPYLNLNKSRCVAACSNNQQVNNGICVCSGSNVYKSIDGQSCLSSCPNYINPNPSIKECVTDCSVFKNFVNPTQVNSQCICPSNYQYIKSDYLQCQQQCDQQQFLHINSKQLYCVQDCPSSIPGSVNPTQYFQRCQCSPQTPLINTDMTQCVSACPNGTYLNLNSSQCVLSCSSIPNAIAQGSKCICQSNYFINFDYQSCVQSCPPDSQNTSGYCQCSIGIDTSTNSCIPDKNITKSYSVIYNYSFLLNVLMMALFI